MSVVISKTTLHSIAENFDDFKNEFVCYANTVSEKAQLLPIFVEFRLRDAHLFWKEDLDRVDAAEPHLKNGLDHFKQGGHLAYWLRRTSPVVEFKDMAGAYSAGCGDLAEDGAALRELLYKCGMEYLAFDWAFQICLFHEKTRPDKTLRADQMSLSRDYIETICHFLKRKNVSPHALSLIFRSLFQ
jgi:hypothetical protein